MNNISAKSKLFVRKNGSTILTILGTVGVVTTAITAIRATPKAMKLIEEAKEEKGEDLTKWETVRATGTVYLPTLVVGTATIVTIFGANMLRQRQQAALLSAYTLLDQAHKEYKQKTIELYGDDADKEIRSEIAKDNYNEESFYDEYEEDDGKTLFYDQFSRRYFRSTMEDVLKAEYNINRKLAVNGGAYLNEFYEFLDLALISSGQELGWSSGTLESHYWANWIEFDHEKFETDDGLEGYIIAMRYEPVIDFDYY